MSVDRALRSVIRGILNEEGPNDPKKPVLGGAYLDTPSKVGIAATLLPTAYEFLTGFLGNDLTTNDFPITNMLQLPDGADNRTKNTAISADYRELNRLYDTVTNLGSLGWPATSAWTVLTPPNKGSIKALVDDLLSYKSELGVTIQTESIIEKMDPRGGKNPTRADLVNFILKYLRQNHEQFQIKVKSIDSTARLLSTEVAAYNSAVKNIKEIQD